MVSEAVLQKNPPAVLDHDLKRYFPELLKFESTRELEKSALYRKIKPEVEQILNAVVQEDFAPKSEPPAVAGGLTRQTQNTVLTGGDSINSNVSNANLQPPATAGGSDRISALAWNIERGNVFEGIVFALKNHRHLRGQRCSASDRTRLRNGAKRKPFCRAGTGAGVKIELCFRARLYRFAEGKRRRIRS